MGPGLGWGLPVGRFVGATEGVVVGLSLMVGVRGTGANVIVGTVEGDGDGRGLSVGTFEGDGVGIGLSVGGWEGMALCVTGMVGDGLGAGLPVGV